MTAKEVIDEIKRLLFGEQTTATSESGQPETAQTGTSTETSETEVELPGRPQSETGTAPLSEDQPVVVDKVDQPVNEGGEPVNETPETFAAPKKSSEPDFRQMQTEIQELRDKVMAMSEYAYLKSEYERLKGELVNMKAGFGKVVELMEKFAGLPTADPSQAPKDKFKTDAANKNDKLKEIQTAIHQSFKTK